VLTGARQASIFGLTALRRRMLVSLEISNKDKSYDWFLAWMAHRTQQLQSQAAPSSSSSPRSILSRSVPWIRSHQLSVETAFEQQKNGSSSVRFNLVAGPGTHWFRYQGAWVQVKRERETRSMQMMSGQPWETVTLTTLSKDRNLFPHLLSEARELAMRGHEGKLVVMTAWGIEWRPFGLPRRKRPLKSVVLDEGVSEKIENDVKAFLDRRQWYADRGSAPPYPS
jgi:chaperone BCS1